MRTKLSSGVLALTLLAGCEGELGENNARQNDGDASPTTNTGGGGSSQGGSGGALQSTQAGGANGSGRAGQGRNPKFNDQRRKGLGQHYRAKHGVK